MKRLDASLLMALVAICFLVLGMVIGEKQAKNHNEMLQVEISRTRAVLEKHPHSVIVINKTFAEMIRFKPRKQDVSIDD